MSDLKLTGLNSLQKQLRLGNVMLIGLIALTVLIVLLAEIISGQPVAVFELSIDVMEALIAMVGSLVPQLALDRRE